MAKKPITRLASEMAARLPAGPDIPGITWGAAPTEAIGSVGSRPFVGDPNATQARRDNNDAYMAGLNNRVPLQNMNDLMSPKWLAKNTLKGAKEAVYDPIANFPNAFDPTSGLAPLERVNTALAGGMQLADMITPFMPEGALANALANRAASKAWANHVPTINKPKLSPGQGYGLHVSHIPDLPVIKDIAELRNKGTNFGTPYDSTQWTPPGATYVFGIPQGQPGRAQVNAAVQHAQDAKRAAANNLDNPEIRNYIMYLTRTNPLELPGGPRLTRVADPEYGTHNPFTDGGQSVVGDQEILSAFDLDLGSYNAPRQALDESPLAQAMGTPENQLKLNDERIKVENFERDFVDNLYNRVSMDPEFANYLAYIKRMRSKDALQKMSRARLAARKEAEIAAEEAAYKADWARRA